VRQPPSYLEDYVCDYLQSGEIKPSRSHCGKRLRETWELCDHKRKYFLCEGGVEG